MLMENGKEREKEESRLVGMGGWKLYNHGIRGSRAPSRLDIRHEERMDVQGQQQVDETRRGSTWHGSELSGRSLRVDAVGTFHRVSQCPFPVFQTVNSEQDGHC
jgi:hypothetical protein